MRRTFSLDVVEWSLQYLSQEYFAVYYCHSWTLTRISLRGPLAYPDTIKFWRAIRWRSSGEVVKLHTWRKGLLMLLFNRRRIVFHDYDWPTDISIEFWGQVNVHPDVFSRYLPPRREDEVNGMKKFIYKVVMYKWEQIRFKLMNAPSSIQRPMDELFFEFSISSWYFCKTYVIYLQS